MSVTGNARQTILIVDDTPDNIMLLSTLLKDRYHTKVANSGIAAVHILHTLGAVDLILLDVMMPELDGYETCRRLKADPDTAAIPVIFLTAKNRAEDEAQGRALGAVDFLSKPINPGVLFSRVAMHLTARNVLRVPD
ncbi:response regulator [Rugamonas sp. CCM 8940]|uniref:response regulator n=1 Tax=Rugamonas sp. CCM 8940 TaxID=2765359 RepID=UPI0018F3400A|nr:response regulator [Rugamonas sp. CCM 8940]MBJ7313084.1 response regulator [Rugamonas sp. CCM 8940]